MISVGIDVSKGKSTVCILKPYGEIVSKPFNITHTQKDLSELSSMLFRLNDEVKIVMEATGIYHLPVLTYLQEKGFFVYVINPYLTKVCEKPKPTRLIPVSLLIMELIIGLK